MDMANAHTGRSFSLHLNELGVESRRGVVKVRLSGQELRAASWTHTISFISATEFHTGPIRIEV
jgi:hypothetical protein